MIPQGLVRLLPEIPALTIPQGKKGFHNVIHGSSSCWSLENTLENNGLFRRPFKTTLRQAYLDAAQPSLCPVVYCRDYWLSREVAEVERVFMELQYFEAFASDPMGLNLETFRHLWGLHMAEFRQIKVKGAPVLHQRWEKACKAIQQRRDELTKRLASPECRAGFFRTNFDLEPEPCSFGDTPVISAVFFDVRKRFLPSEPLGLTALRALSGQMSAYDGVSGFLLLERNAARALTNNLKARPDVRWSAWHVPVENAEAIAETAFVLWSEDTEGAFSHSKHAIQAATAAVVA